MATVTEVAAASDQQQNILKELLVHFSVEQPFKGVAVDRLEVATSTGTDCDLDFEIGEQYFVYAYQILPTKRLTTGACTRTRKLSIAKEDMDQVRELLAMSPHRTWLIGRDGKPSSLLAGSEVIVESQGKVSTTLVKKGGDFTVELPGAGTYQVTIIAPAGVELLNHSTQWRIFDKNGRSAVQFERPVAEGQCEFLDFSLMLTARKKSRD